MPASAWHICQKDESSLGLTDVHSWSEGSARACALPALLSGGKFLLSLVRLLSLGLLSRGALRLLSHGGLLRLRTKSGCAHADALWLIVLRTLKGERQNAVLQLCIHFVGIDLKRKSEGADESATTTLSTMVSPGIVRLVLALSAKGHGIAVNCDFKVVLLNAGQLGCYHDPILMSVDIDRRESGLWRSRALRKPVNLLLEKPHVAEWTAGEHVCDHGHVTPVAVISFRPCLASAAQGTRLRRSPPSASSPRA